MFSCGALRTAVCTAVVTIIAYTASAGAAFEGRALATASPSVDGEPLPSTPPPEAGTTEPTFSVDASRETGRPGDPVKVAFALPRESGGSSQGGSAFVVLPPVSKVVSPSLIPGDPAGGGGPLVTEPPDVAPVERPQTVPGSNESSLPIGVPLLLVILAAGGIAVALITGRKRAASLDAASLRAGSAGAGPLASGGPPPGGDEVRVVPHAGSGPRVTVREAHRSLTNVVRLEPHNGVPMVEVEERK